MKNEIHVQARALIIKDEHILLCKTTGLEENFYFLPGGHIEHWEGARTALQRELLEETGVNFHICRFLGCLEYSFDPAKTTHAKCHTHEYDFIFEATNGLLGEPGHMLSEVEGHIKLAFVPLAQLDEIDLRPKPLKDILPKWLEDNMDTAFQSQMV
jgi:ADP-ribose pyrophosphatase YjhB (NUDIX family)